LAGSSLLALIDDIATLLDDVSAMTGVAARKTAFAAKKTAGVLGDDLALNAQQVAGVRADRELPVVWAVFKGSAVNKAILVPCALLLSAFLPWIITPLLMLGGAFLCYEGFEKVAHKLLHTAAEDEAEHDQRLDAVMDPDVDMVEFERQRIKGAIRTDAILSAEIIVIALGTVQDSSMGTQIAVLTAIAVLMTIGVYGLVAAIVKLDDAGLHLLQQSSRARQVLGRLILRLAPRLMSALSVLGTAAMFLVGGGILVHGFPPTADVLHYLEEVVHGIAGFGGLLGVLVAVVFNGLVGVIAGAIIVGAQGLFKRLLARKPSVDAGR
jgi:predicted DNA repair protein MutK